MNPTTIVRILVALAFAWSMGAHCTGACMGMPYATKSIGLAGALWTMAPLTLVGATFLSRRVPENVGHTIPIADRLAIGPAIAVIVAAFFLTTAFTWRRGRVTGPPAGAVLGCLLASLARLS